MDDVLTFVGDQVLYLGVWHSHETMPDVVVDYLVGALEAWEARNG